MHAVVCELLIGLLVFTMSRSSLEKLCFKQVDSVDKRNIHVWFDCKMTQQGKDC